MRPRRKTKGLTVVVLFTLLLCGAAFGQAKPYSARNVEVTKVYGSGPGIVIEARDAKLIFVFGCHPNYCHAPVVGATYFLAGDTAGGPGCDWYALVREGEELNHVCLALAEPAPPKDTTNQSTEKTEPPAKSPSDTADKHAFGTGFFVSSEGHILTNNHVVAECKTLATRDGKPLRLISRNVRADLALLRADTPSTSFAVFRIGPAPKLGDAVVAFGFPLPDLLSSEGNVATGILSATSGLQDDVRFVQISAPVQPGNSGGPLLDQSGHVIGVVVAKLDALRVASAIGDIPQNVNFAIRWSEVRAFLDEEGVPYRKATSQQAMSTPDVAALARRMSVLIDCTETDPHAELGRPNQADPHAEVGPPQSFPEKVHVPTPAGLTASYKNSDLSFRYPQNWRVEETPASQTQVVYDAVLRNGYAIRHHHQEKLQGVTRLYLDAGPISAFVDIPTEEILFVDRQEIPRNGWRVTIAPSEAHIKEWVTHGFFVGHITTISSPFLSTLEGALEERMALYKKNTTATFIATSKTVRTVGDRQGLMVSYNAPSPTSVEERGHLIVIRDDGGGYYYFLMFSPNTHEETHLYARLFSAVLNSVKFEKK